MASGDASPSVMINGLPGAMGLAIAAVCERRGVRVAPFALTGPGMPSETAVGDVSWRSTRRTRATSSRRA